MMKKIDLQAAEKCSFKGNLGAIFSRKRTVFRLWQPFAEKAFLRLYNAENEPLFSAEMKRRGSVFEYVKSGCCEGLLYDFSVTDGGEERCFADIYACSVNSDGTRGIVTDMQKNMPDGWENDSFISFKEPERAVIYELSVRDFSMDKNADFSAKGKFSAFCEENVHNSYGESVGTEYIKNLGVTHIQLMPVFDFDFDKSEYNWGYNPGFFNSPCRYYSLDNVVYELRELVLAAHRAGIGVVADVVYNHVFSAENSSFEKQINGYFFRGSGNFSNGSGCGNEFASERIMARKFIADSLEFLLKEYHFDGFRFDLMGLTDIKTLRKIEKRLRRINPSVMLYGEGWTGGESPLSERFRAVQRNAEKLPSFSFFNDSFRDAVKGNVFDKNDCGFVNGKADISHFKPIFSALSGVFSEDFWAKNPSQVINYVECHDNQTLFDKLRITLNNADFRRICRAEKMAAAFVFLSCGIAFFQAGQEFLRTKNFSENSYNLPDEINSLKWDLMTKNSETVNYYRGLIAFRKRFYGVFRNCVLRNFDEYFVCEKNDFILIVNSSDRKITTDYSGKFEIFADEINASDVPLYSSKRLCCAEFSVLLARRKVDES